MASKKKLIKLNFTPTHNDFDNQSKCVSAGIRVFPIPSEGGYKVNVQFSSGKIQSGSVLFSLYDMNWLKKVYEIYGVLSKKI